MPLANVDVSIGKLSGLGFLDAWFRRWLSVNPIDREALRFAPIDVHSPLHQGCRMTLPHFASPEAVVATLSPSTPVYCVRPAALHRAARLFLDHFPGDVLYAVKCNPGAHILRELSHAVDLDR